MSMRSIRPARPSTFIEPCLATKATRPPSGDGWWHEIKHDGYRLQIERSGPAVRLLTRRGHDWTDRFPVIERAAKALRCASAVIDGEAVALDETGLAIFERLRRRGPSVFLYA